MTDRSHVTPPLRCDDYYTPYNGETLYNWIGAVSVADSLPYFTLNSPYSFKVESKPGFYVYFGYTRLGIKMTEEEAKKESYYRRLVRYYLNDAAKKYKGTAWEPLILAEMEEWK